MLPFLPGTGEARIRLAAGQRRVAEPPLSLVRGGGISPPQPAGDAVACVCAKPQIGTARISFAVHNVCRRRMTPAAPVLSCACPGDEKRGGPGAAAQHRSRGRQSGYLAWLAARPAERQRGVRMQRSRERHVSSAGEPIEQASKRPGHDRAGRSRAQQPAVEVADQSGAARTPCFSSPTLERNGPLRGYRAWRRSRNKSMGKRARGVQDSQCPPSTSPPSTPA